MADATMQSSLPASNPAQPRVGVDQVQNTRLVAALKRLDARLVQAMQAAQAAYGAGSDPFRGLHISPQEVTRLLARPPFVSPLVGPSNEPLAEPASPAIAIPGSNGGAAATPALPLVSAEPDPADPLARLKAIFQLSSFDMDLLVVALAPELDLRYERLYAYLQDDVAKRRPTVDLALNLTCRSPAEKLLRRASFAPEAPLVRGGLLHLLPDAYQTEPPILAHILKPDELVLRYLLGEPGLDRRLIGFAELLPVDRLPDETGSLPAGLVEFCRGGLQAGSVRLYFHGPVGVGKRHAAACLARALELPLLAADLRRVDLDETVPDGPIEQLARAAALHGAVLYLSGLESLNLAERPALELRLAAALGELDGVVVLASMSPTPALTLTGMVSLPFPRPGFAARRQAWQAALTAHDLDLPPDELDTLAGNFVLTPAQVTSAAAEAANRHRWRAAAGADVSLASAGPLRKITAAGAGPLRKITAAGAEPLGKITAAGAEPLGKITAAGAECFAAARAQSAQNLADMAQRLEPGRTWQDLVLPEDALEQLHELCRRVTLRGQVLEEWGFARKLTLGKGVTALFAGPSGVGKTLAVEVIAGELGLDCYRIELSGVVSKYIGETEKNLERIFRLAEHANAILFFDEADALFGKRSEVRDSHDRYANIEIAYLLQKMEAYEGLAILATNLRQNLDESFVRRLAFTIHFPFPDEESRLRIWQHIWPAETPLAEDVDLRYLAQEYKLSGGNIRNIALAAAYLAAEDGDQVRMAHLLHATRREFQKLGKTVAVAFPGGDSAGEEHRLHREMEAQHV